MLPKFSVIVPAHNEAVRIESALRDYAAVFADSEIVVVLNGCEDRTAPIVAALCAEFGNISTVEIEEPVGKGGAIRAGFLLARAPVVAYVDADHATTGMELRRLCEILDERDGLIGSRWISGATVQVAQPASRRIASRIFNALVRLLFGLKYSDTQCGSKVFRSASIRKILPHVETANFAFDVDLLFTMKAAGMRVHETPTIWRDVHGSHVDLFSASSRMLASILRLRIRHSFLRIVVPVFDRLFPTRPMRAHDGFNILLLNWRDPKHPQAGGAEKYLHEMAKRWLSAGHAVEWLCGSFRGAPRHEIVDGIRVTRVGNAMTVYGALPLEYLRSFRDRFDVIIDAENGIPFFSPLFSLKPKICLVHHVHKDVFKQHLPLLLAQVLTWMECRLMPRLYRTGRFVAVSEDTRSAMRDIGIPGQSIDVVRNGVDAGLLPGAKFAQPTIVYLGRLKRYKRIDHIIDALARVRAVLPDAVLHIAGDGDDRARLQSYAGARGLEDAVVFEGFVDENRKLRLLQGSWIFVSASEIEGWGISVAEANACGTPAVSYSVPGLREVIINGFNGFTIAQGGDLAEPILDVLRDCDMRSRLEAGAVRRAAEFSWDQSAEMMMEVIVRTVVGDRFGLVKMRGRWNFVTSSVSTDGALEAVQKVLV